MTEVNKAHIKLNNTFSLIIIFTSFFCSMICMFLHFTNEFEYGNIWLIPLAYSILYVVCKKNRQAIGKPGITTMNLIMYIRYVFLPLSIYLNDSVSYITCTYAYMDLACAMMLYEMIAIFATISFFYKQFYSIKHSNAFAGNYRYFYRKIPKIVMAIIVFLAIIVAICYPSIIGSLDIIKGEVNLELLDEVSQIFGLFTIIWGVGITIFTLIILCYFKEKHNKNEYKLYIFMSIIVAAFFLLTIYIGSIRISRWHLLVSTVSLGALLFTFYPKNKKFIIIWLVVPMFILLGVATNQKANLGAELDSNLLSNFVMGITETTMLDIYFAGPVNVNTAVLMVDEYGDIIGLNSLIFDIVNNLPTIGKNIPKEETTVYLFNQVLDRKDQIIPMVGQSYAYFGFLLSPLLSIVFTILVMYFDNALYKAKNPYMFYAYVFSAVWTGLFPCLDMTIILSWFYSRIIPLFLVNKINEIVQIKSQKINRTSDVI